MTLKEKIKKVKPDTVVALKNAYGIYFIGKAKYVYQNVTNKAWYGEDTKVVINGKEI